MTFTLCCNFPFLKNLPSNFKDIVIYTHTCILILSKVTNTKKLLKTITQNVRYLICNDFVYVAIFYSNSQAAEII